MKHALAAFLLLLTASCGRPDEPVTVRVDSTLTVPSGELPGFEGNDPRLVSVLDDGSGAPIAFVQNELVVVTDDADALDAFVARWGGELLDSRTSPGMNDQLSQIHLVRVDTSAADVSTLAADLATLTPDSRGDLVVSDQEGLELLAAATTEALGGTTVAVNWVAEPTSVLDRVSTEAPVGPAGYSPNAFQWSYYQAGGNQNIGVGEAWRALELAGQADERVKVAVIDMGFQPDDDTPAGWRAISIVPGKQPVGVANTWGGNGTGILGWHGTAVSSTLAAKADNAYGAAGVAAPVADLVMITSGYDYFSAIAALLVARAEGADIVNMSFSANVPTVVAFTVYPFEWATMDAWDHGHLVFASAGNDGRNVDAVIRDAFGTSWGEEAWWTPCENNGVICVGGIGWNTVDRDGGSNFGDEHVDIYAPYNVYVGPYPGEEANEVYEAHGTSFSSPFAAGVAALVWAADPGLSASQVRAALYTSAFESRDPDVKRYVNAWGAVMGVLDEQDPYVSIVYPPEGSVWPLGHPVSFRAESGDLEDGDAPVLWTSNLDSLLGGELEIVVDFLRVGTHEVSATAFDLAGNLTTDVVEITVTNDPPVVQILEPATGGTFLVGETVTLRAETSDYNVPPSFVLDDGDVAWTSSIEGAVGSGHELATTLSEGDHVITVTATDSEGVTDEDWINLSVVGATSNTAPVVAITSPGADVTPSGPDWLAWQFDGYDAAAGHHYKDVAVVGLAADEEDGLLTGATLVWTTDRTDLQPAVLATGTSPTLRLYGNGCSDEHHVTLTATDSEGLARSAVRVILLWAVC